jgi:NAD-dependent deacetylase
MAKHWRQAAEQAAEILAGSRTWFALTGAGISVHSGIPDFRSPGGLWSRFDPEEVASDHALRTNPRAVWEFLYEAVNLFGKAEPNQAHITLAEMERDGRLLGVVTQNIDSLHQAAGSQNVVEFHGSCERFYCMGCHRDYDTSRFKTLTRDDLPVLCDECGGLIRPDVVFFGEAIPRNAFMESDLLAEQSDALIIVGTSGFVAPANTYASRMKYAGKQVIEVNIGATAYQGVADVSIDGPAEEVLPELYRLVSQ